MNIVHRQIDFVKDKEYVLERHCRINYECDCPWVREIAYDDYRKDWFSLKNQINGFYEYLEQILFYKKIRQITGAVYSYGF